MFPKINPQETQSWKSLEEKYSQVKNRKVKSLFDKDSKRFQHYSIQIEGILFDYSKNNIDEDTLELLIQLAEECQL